MLPDRFFVPHAARECTHRARSAPRFAFHVPARCRRSSAETRGANALDGPVGNVAGLFAILRSTWITAMIPRADYDASAVIPPAWGIFRDSTRDYFHRCCIDTIYPDNDTQG